MANIPSQKKRILRAEREHLENRRYTSKIRTYFHRLEGAVSAGDSSQVETEHRVLVQTIDKAVKRGAIHRNTGARKKSRAARLRHQAHAPSTGAARSPAAPPAASEPASSGEAASTSEETGAKGRSPRRRAASTGRAKK